MIGLMTLHGRVHPVVGSYSHTIAVQGVRTIYGAKPPH
jgi:hypothetical protein